MTVRRRERPSFRIRGVRDEKLPVNRAAIDQVREIMKARFPAGPGPAAERLDERLRTPFQQRFRSILYVAESRKGGVTGFALLYHDPVLRFCFLDYLASRLGFTGKKTERGLYRRVRREAVDLGARGLFLECLSDEPGAELDRRAAKKNASRLRFFERFSARPVIGTRYEAPLRPGLNQPTHLVFDGLGRRNGPRREFVRRVVRAILKRKFGHRCPPEYIREVVESVTDDPVRLRPARYFAPSEIAPRVDGAKREPVTLVASGRHFIPGPPGRSYVESPVRVDSILSRLPAGRFQRIPPRAFPEKHILAVHDRELVNYLRRGGRKIPRETSLYPYVFPIRNKNRLPDDHLARGGCYCIDTLTPLNRSAYLDAKRAVDCSLTAARHLLEGASQAYALVSPPGHHAERNAFGGYSYFNNAAAAAQYLSANGKVAVLDLDYHHGNGQQQIFYQRSDVLTVSLHGHPRFAYPYFAGFEDERGEGKGEGFNLNLPLPQRQDGKNYRRALERALRAILEFKPSFLVVALGLDTARGDPTGTWLLTARDFRENGAMIAELGVPTLVVQEGGHRIGAIGTNARNFFAGLTSHPDCSLRHRRFEQRARKNLTFRYEVRAEDRRKIREMIEATSVFSPAETEVAVELAEERMAKGPASGYHFVFADYQEQTIGYSCYGPIPGTASSFDLYWITIHPDSQGRGWGRMLLRETERRIRAMGGTRVYIDTSNRPHYAETRAFYESGGYRLAARLDNFYSAGDAKTIYCKVF